MSYVDGASPVTLMISTPTSALSTGRCWGATSLRAMAMTSSSATRRGNNASSGAYPVAGASGGQPARRNATTLDTRA